MRPVNRAEAERAAAHPVFAAFMRHEDSRSFARTEVRQRVVPIYMGLVKQIDDQIGRLMTFLEESGRRQNTIIIFTSDHGDYLGDHWLGEKDLYHEESIRIPLIIVDPSAEADSTRGTVNQHLVESIDLLPTLVELAGGRPQPQRLEGRSLRPLLHGEAVADWRDCVISEMDYSGREARLTLNLSPSQCRATLLRSQNWKYILHENFRPQLFDLKNDPQELVDLGADPAYQAIRSELHERLFTWFRRPSQRTTVTDTEIETTYNVARAAKQGLFIGRW
jgi:arylsulfatase A-like enzyme